MCWRIICVQLRIILPAVVFNPTPCSNGAVTTCSSSSVETVKPSSQGTDHSKVIIDDLRFGSPIHLPESVIDEAIAEANGYEMDATNSNWVNEFVEAGLRSAWQDRGYFRVTAGRAEIEALGGDSHDQHFRVFVPVNEGLQYHLGALAFTGGTAFSFGELRGLIPLREGEIFDISKIRAGIAALTKKYDANGYIDFTAVPKTDIDDKLQRISLTLELDEQKQYRIGNVSVTGLDPTLEGVLRSTLVIGEIFNPATIDGFVKESRSSSPNINPVKCAGACPRPPSRSSSLSPSSFRPCLGAAQSIASRKVESWDYSSCRQGFSGCGI